MSNVLKMLSRGGAAAAETDPNFKQTVLLLHGDGTNGAQNNTFLDSSTNNFTITRNGNTTQGTFSPFSVGTNEWSVFFNSSASDYAQLEDAVPLQLGTGNFTIEAWIYTVSNNTQQPICCKGGSSSGFQIEISSTNKLSFIDGTTANDSTNNVSVNAWTHIAVVREGTGTNQTKIYINGVASGSFTVSTDFIQTNRFRISTNRTGNIFFNGYISNLRVVKGTAVYTTAFTPSTTPLTAITNTSLLTCQSNNFIDKSSNNYAITIVGTRVTPFSPFAPTAAYSAGTNGGSGYFDGTGDYLTITSGVTNQFDPGSAFTFECWFYQSSGTSNLCFEVRGTLNSFDASNGILFRVWPNSSGSTFFQFNTAGAATSISTTAPPYNTWVHLAVGYNGTTTRFWVNGVSAGTSTASYTKPTYDRVTIGNSFANANPFFGYLSNMRFVKGSDVYGVSNTTITVPTSPVTAITNTSLLLNFTNAGIIDNTGKNNLETVGNAQIDTTTKKFGTGSLEFNGPSDYLSIPTTPDLDFGSGNFTVECWVYITQYTSLQYEPIFANAYLFYLGTSGQVLLYNGSTDVLSTGNNQVPLNTWVHLAWVRSSGTVTIYVNGTSQASGTVTASIGSGNPNFIGRHSTIYLNGYIDDLRITKGVARYTANFTAPTKEFPDL